MWLLFAIQSQFIAVRSVLSTLTTFTTLNTLKTTHNTQHTQHTQHITTPPTIRPRQKQLPIRSVKPLLQILNAQRAVEHQPLPLLAHPTVVQHAHTMIPLPTPAALSPLLLVRVLVRLHLQLALLYRLVVAHELLAQQLVTVLTPHVLRRFVDVVTLVQLDHVVTLATAMQRLALQPVVAAMAQRTQTHLLFAVFLVQRRVLLLQLRKQRLVVLLHHARVLRERRVLALTRPTQPHLVVPVTVREQQLHVSVERRDALVLAARVLLVDRLQINRILDHLVVHLAALRRGPHGVVKQSVRTRRDDSSSVKLLLTHAGNDAGNLDAKTRVLPPRGGIQRQTRRICDDLGVTTGKRRNLVVGKEMKEGWQGQLLLRLVLNALALTEWKRRYGVIRARIVAQLTMRVPTHLQMGDGHPKQRALLRVTHRS